MKIPSIEKVQRRIANISVGPSTLRGQPRGTIKTAREFFMVFNFEAFKDCSSEEEFLKKLDEQTELLRNKLPSQSWGISRKALNLFLFQSAHDIYLCEKNNLRRLIPFFEVVLDNPNAKIILTIAEKEGVSLIWRNIKSLNKEENKLIQEFAKRIASERNYERCYLDLDFWRGDE